MSVITLKNVRLSFPQIWTAKAFNEGQTKKYSANFLLDKDTDKEQLENLKKAKENLIYTHLVFLWLLARRLILQLF